MRILQVTAADYGGGAERAARDLHLGLLEAGEKSFLLAGRRRGAALPESDFLYDRSWLFNRALSRTRQYLEAATGRQASFHNAMDRWWLHQRPESEVVVYHNLHDNYFNLDVLPTLARRRRVVHVLHDLWLLTGHCAYPMNCGNWGEGCGNCPDLARPPFVLLDRTRQQRRRKSELLHRSAATLVCVSKWVDRQVASSGLANLQRVVIPYGIPDVPPRIASREQIRTRLGWPLDKKIFLYVSSGGLRGSAYKDPGTLIQCAGQLLREGRDKDMQIVSVGGLRQLDSSLSRILRQYAHVADGLEDLYAAADYMIYPTRVETVGLVLVEAARAGLPTIASAVGGCPEVVAHGDTGLVVEPLQPGALVRAIDTILTMNRDRLAANARQRYLDLFTRDRMIGAYRALFGKLVAPRPSVVPASTAVRV